MSPPAPATAVRGVLFLLGSVAVLYLIAMPLAVMAWEWLASSSNTGRIQRLPDETPISEWLFLKSLETAMATIFFTLGASVGSFLNVVIYRWPRGKPLFWQRSYCPNCRASIRSSDNVPLVGWLRLGGRCRDCGSQISSRYPWVEATMGTIFLWLFVIQLISGGWNLANRQPNVYTGVVWVLFYTKWDLVGYYFYHCLLYSLLLIALLIDYDRQRLRSWQVALGILWLLVPPLLWPSLLLWRIDVVAWPTVNALVTMLVGGLVGAVFGRLLCSTGLSWVSGLWVGIALGWQATLGIFLFAFLLQSWATIWRWSKIVIGSRRPTSPTIPSSSDVLSEPGETHNSFPASGAAGSTDAELILGTTWILVGTILHHSFWRMLTVSFAPYWPGATLTWGLLLSWCVLFCVVFSFERLVGVFLLPRSTNQARDPEFT